MAIEEINKLTLYSITNRVEIRSRGVVILELAASVK